jgi:hypothetical protein
MIRAIWSAWLSCAAWFAGYRAGKMAASWLRGAFFGLIYLILRALGLGIAGIRALLRAYHRRRASKRLKKRIE